MKRNTIGVLAALLVPLACGNVADLGVESATTALETTAEILKIGLLVESTAPGKSDFIAAANLAESNLNEGLEAAGAAHRFDVLVTEYTSPGHQDAAIDLVNNQGVLGLVTDANFTSAEVNRLNYEFVPRINYKVPITCYQCSSADFHSSDETDPGFRDPEGWLFRTYFNGNFEAPLQVRMVRSRMRGGDLNDDGHIKIVVWHDPEHLTTAFNIGPAFDSLYSGPHSTEVWTRGSSPDIDIPNILDDQPDGHFPDVVVMLMRSQEAIPNLTAYKNFSAPSKPPIQVNDDVRRDELLPALIGIGLPGLQGTSMLRVNNSGSGSIFRNAFSDATGHLPEMTASSLYDAIVMHAGAISWAFHFGSTDTAVIQGNFPNVNDPSGATIRPRPSDFETAAVRINNDLPINYDGAASSVDIDFTGENYPDLATWRIQNGAFSNLDLWRCDPEHPNCRN